MLDGLLYGCIDEILVLSLLPSEISQAFFLNSPTIKNIIFLIIKWLMQVPIDLGLHTWQP